MGAREFEPLTEENCQVRKRDGDPHVSFLRCLCLGAPRCSARGDVKFLIRHTLGLQGKLRGSSSFLSAWSNHGEADGVTYFALCTDEKL